jgi:hypothetical protein
MILLLPEKLGDAPAVMLVEIHTDAYKRSPKNYIARLERAFSLNGKKPQVLKGTFTQLEKACKSVQLHYLNLKKNKPVIFRALRSTAFKSPTIINNNHSGVPTDWSHYWLQGTFFVWNTITEHLP